MTTLCYCDQNCYRIRVDVAFRSTDQQPAKDNKTLKLVIQLVWSCRSLTS